MMTDRADGFTDDTTELAQCAQINFQNMENMCPSLRVDPFWLIAMQQFNAVVHRMESDEI